MNYLVSFQSVHLGFYGQVSTGVNKQLSKSDVTPGARNAAATGESYAPRTTPVMEPDEVSLVFGRSDPQLRQLIIRAGARPMILQRAYYDKHDTFRTLRT